MGMADIAGVLSNPVLALILRAALGAYIVYMARSFYADPFGYFRKWMPAITETEIARRLIRGLACFCVWGGSFIVLAALATELLNMHGLPLAFVLVALAAIAAWFLLPRDSAPLAANKSGNPN